jgi:hypothetical protein
MGDDPAHDTHPQEGQPMQRTVTLEVQLDVDVPEGVHWSDDIATAFEDWLATDVLNPLDGRDITLSDVSMHIEGHSVTRIANTWPYR